MFVRFALSFFSFFIAVSQAARADYSEVQRACEQSLERIIPIGREYIPLEELGVWHKGMRAAIGSLSGKTPLYQTQHDFDIFDEAAPTLAWMQERLAFQGTRFFDSINLSGERQATKLSGAFPVSSLRFAKVFRVSRRLQEIQAARRLTYKDFHNLVPSFVSAMHSHISRILASHNPEGESQEFSRFNDMRIQRDFSLREPSEFEDDSRLYSFRYPFVFFWPTREQTAFSYFNRLRPLSVYPNALVSEVGDYDSIKVVERLPGASGVGPKGKGLTIYSDVIGFFWEHDHGHADSQASRDLNDFIPPGSEISRSFFDYEEVAKLLPGVLSKFEARIKLIQRWREDLARDTPDRAKIREGIFFYITHESPIPGMKIELILRALRSFSDRDHWEFKSLISNPDNLGLPNDPNAVLDAVRVETEFFRRMATDGLGD